MSNWSGHASLGLKGKDTMFSQFIRTIKNSRNGEMD